MDANSLHRCLGPWSVLTRDNRDLYEFQVAQDDLGMQGFGWNVVCQFDAIFFHRPCREDDLKVMQIAHLHNVPTWIDYDDWLFEVPYWNPHAAQYANQRMHEIMATMIACADVVSVTTSALYDKFKAVNKNVVIIPNMYRDDLARRYHGKVPHTTKDIFAWRGTNTHDADVLSVAEGFKRLSKPTWFFGGAPWLLLSQMRPGTFHQLSIRDPFVYMKELYFTSPKVFLCPLMDCLFNRVKSNIAYQEALHAGALCVAPDLPEWKRPGVVTYRPGDALDFLAAAESIMVMKEEDRAEQVRSAYKHMVSMYGTETINPIRVATLEAIIADDFELNEKDPRDQLVGLWALGQLKPKPSEPLQAVNG